MTETAFQTLAQRLGIVGEYTDFHSKRVQTGRATQHALLRAFGFDAETEEDAKAHLAALGRGRGRA